jgi:molecular chaperone GrpE
MTQDQQPTRPESQPPADAPAPEERTAELESRARELEARWLRAQADYQNLKRRTQAELDAALLRTLQPLLAELLLGLDYLDLALGAPVTSPEARSLAAGVELTRAQLARALEAAEVRPLPVEERFDPAKHEAADTRRTDQVPPGTILETVRTGYTWQGRVLRPARVVVAAAASVEEHAPSDGEVTEPSQEA